MVISLVLAEWHPKAKREAENDVDAIFWPDARKSFSFWRGKWSQHIDVLRKSLIKPVVAEWSPKTKREAKPENDVDAIFWPDARKFTSLRSQRRSHACMG